MKAVFLDRSTIDPSINLERLQSAVAQLVCYPTTSQSQLIQNVQDADIVITNKVEIGEQHLAQLADLKLLCIAATGTNNVDLTAAKKLGIAVTNVSGYSTTSVAQHVFAYLLKAVNQTSFYHSQQRTKPWHQSQIFCQINQPINELAGNKLGIFGFGNLGQTVANIAQAFAMQVLISERPGATQIRQGRVSFETMLAESDVISLHCPLTPQTNNLFTESVFQKMKPGCVFINTARGPIVNSVDLVSALKSGHLGHAIIDVLEQEPPLPTHPVFDHSLMSLENLTLTPHIAWGSIQAQQRLMDLIAQNINDFRRGKKTNRVEI